MQSILNVPAVSELRITDDAADLFAGYIKSQTKEILKNSRSYLEPVMATGTTRITKWVIPHDDKHKVNEPKTFRIAGQEITLDLKKSHFFEVTRDGEKRKVDVYLPNYTTDVLMETYWQFYELGKILEPISIMIRTLMPEFRDLDNFTDMYGRPRVGTALACAFHGIGVSAVNNANINTISSVSRIAHGLNVLDFIRKADLYRDLYFDLKNNKLDKLKNDDSLPKLGVDGFNLAVNDVADGVDETGSVIRGVSYREGINDIQRPRPLIDSEIIGSEESTVYGAAPTVPKGKLATKK